jgi:hypothetical protein
MKALFSKRSLLQFLIFIVLVVVINMIAGALGYDISGVMGLLTALGGGTLVWWTLEAAKKSKIDDTDA